MGFCATVMIVGSTQIFEEGGRKGEFINDLRPLAGRAFTHGTSCPSLLRRTSPKCPVTKPYV